MNIPCSCNTCSHRGICKYQDRMQAFINEIEIFESPIKNEISEIVDIYVNCKKYRSDSGIIKEIRRIPSEMTNVDEDPCKSCPTYRNMLSGIPFIGDSPCMHCSHNKFIITNDSCQKTNNSSESKKVVGD